MRFIAPLLSLPIKENSIFASFMPHLSADGHNRVAGGGCGRLEIKGGKHKLILLEKAETYFQKIKHSESGTGDKPKSSTTALERGKRGGWGIERDNTVSPKGEDKGETEGFSKNFINTFLCASDLFRDNSKYLKCFVFFFKS